MAKQKKKSDWKHLLSAGSIVVAVVGALILGWAMQSDPEEKSGQVVIDGSMPDHQFPAPLPPAEIEPEEVQAEQEAETPESGPSPAEAAPAVVEPTPPSDNLRDRTRQDLTRMRAAGDRWTLKFATLFNEESARQKLALLSGHDQFYLVPATVNGRPCHRLCWGLYPTKDAALAARGVPRALTEIADQPQPTPAQAVAQ